CTPFSWQDRSGGKGMVVRGKLVLPFPYFSDFCRNGGQGGEYPPPFARIIVGGEEGDSMEGFADCSGVYEIQGVVNAHCILYAQREGVVVAKGISDLRSDRINETGVVNAYSTAQVAIFEAAFRLYPQSVYFRDIPNFIPSKTLVKLVEEALQRGENPLESQDVREEAHRLIDVWFGG
ncbi:MAG: hypothetical protein ABDK94_02130, partial [Atribacterota bacterium]